MTPGDADQMFWFAFVAVCAAGFVLLATCVRGAAWFLWTACLVPLFLLGKTFATVGVAPVYLMDGIAAFALLAAAGAWAPRAFSEYRLTGFRWVALLLAVVTVPAVWRGVAAGYPDPLKGVILGLYPVVGWLAATWLLTRTDRELVRLRWVLYVPALGVLLQVVLHMPMVPAASGLYLAIAGAFGVRMRYAGDSRLLLVTLVGLALLTAADSKRGPLLTVLAGCDVRRPPVRRPAPWAVAAPVVVRRHTGAGGSHQLRAAGPYFGHAGGGGPGHPAGGRRARF